MGRPSKFTDAFVDDYLKAIAAGVPPETAAVHAGASPASLYRYLKGSSPRHLAFRQEHERALAALEIRLAATISRAALTDPRWALALLHHRFPERWGRSQSAVGLENDATRGRTTDTIVVLDPDFVSRAVPLLLEAGRAMRGLSDPGDEVDVADFEDDGMPRDADDPDPDVDSEVS